MNILLISQCHKNALKETRRIIDQFAERTGERSWQTHITQKGLDALHRLLRQSARKNTAVACHWIHGKNHSELLWVVGDRSQFNDKGRVPTNRTQRNILRSADECRRICAYDIQIVAVMAALLHDLGKATVHFQNKLQKNQVVADEYRHEWVSLRLFRNMLSGCLKDEDWLTRLANWQDYLKEKPKWYELTPEPSSNNRRDFYCFSDLPPLARLVAWLIVSHHRLPLYDDYCKLKNNEFQKEKQFITIDEWFKNFIPTAQWVYNDYADKMDYRIECDPTVSEIWQKELSRWANKALQRICSQHFFNYPNNLLQDPLFLHLSRLCLIVGDHYFSAQKYNEKNQKKYALSLWANNDKNRPSKAKQLLDEHLCGVANVAKQFARSFLWTEEPFATLQKCKNLAKPALDKRFFWQNTAFELGRKLHNISQEQGFFGVNTAGTGCGKTLANVKIMYALSGEKNIRLTIALGLRTLTLQTGKALQEKLHLKDNELATLIGSSAILYLFQNNQDKDKQKEQEALWEQQEAKREQQGSLSAQELFLSDEENFAELRYESAHNEVIFNYLMAEPKLKTLLDTPIIACTIDHLMQVCEQQRGGRFAAPLLRLLSSDIILDEPDDFSVEDLPALSRLLYWIGLCGGRVLLSSATLTPDLCIGLFRAYQDGRKIYHKHFSLPENSPICCAWFNEFTTQHAICAGKEDYKEQHQKFCQQQIEKLQQLPVRRRGEILALESGEYSHIAEKLLITINTLHQRYGEEYQGKKISLGLVRFANIGELIQTAQALLQSDIDLPDTHLHIVPYHARQLLLLRNRLEKTLDRLLNRNNSAVPLLGQPEIQTVVERYTEKNHIFVVLGSPVTEVGRDHDYDWAVVEPSSLRSLIQLAGRVWRHRPEKHAQSANICIFNKNIKNLKNIRKPDDIFYCRPGFEKKGFYYLNSEQKSAENTQLFSDEILQRIDATFRLKRPEKFNKNCIANNLSDLEHLAMAHLMNHSANYITAYRQPESVFHLTADMQKHSPFRESSPQTAYVAMPDFINDEKINWIQSENLAENPESKAFDNHSFKIHAIESNNSHIHRWLAYAYRPALKELAAFLYHCHQDDLDDKQIRNTACQYATVNLHNNKQWQFDPWLGFSEI